MSAGGNTDIGVNRDGPIGSERTRIVDSSSKGERPKLTGGAQIDDRSLERPSEAERHETRHCHRPDVIAGMTQPDFRFSSSAFLFFGE